MQDLRTVFAMAAELVAEHGHIKGDYGSPEVGFCAAGAIWWAIAGRKRDLSMEISVHNDSFIAALDMTPFGTGGISAWNDNPRTTKDDVIRVLRGVAA